MPRRPLIRNAIYPYHVTIRCNNKEWFDLPMKVVWDICLRAMRVANHKHPVKIRAFVLMQNHYHLIIRTPNCDLDKFMYEFNKGISKRIRKRNGRINRIFGDRYKWTLINSLEYFNNALKYVYRNPIKSGSAIKAEDYPFSSLYYIKYKNNLSIDFEAPYFGDLDRYLEFVNESFSLQYEESLSYGLSRPIFKMKKDHKRRKVI